MYDEYGGNKRRGRQKYHLASLQSNYFIKSTRNRELYQYQYEY